MRLYVTRHGQTAWNALGMVCGSTDLPLDETGLEQAEATAELLRDTPLDAVLCSPLLRARQTAARICAGRELSIVTDERLREQDYGIYEGASREDEGFLQHKRMFAMCYPGGESHMRTARCVYAFLEDMGEAYPGKNVLVVCHGGICRVIESYFHDLTNDEYFRFTTKNCEVRQYEYGTMAQDRK